MILSCHHIYKSFGTTEILKDISFHMEERQKIALIGANGAGKSTLLKIITGEYSADSGEAVLAKGKALGYLSQHQDLAVESTIYDGLLQAKADVLELEQRIRELEQQMKHTSGDQLERLLNTYTTCTQEFEQKNGYAYKSEVTGVLKGLGFTESDFTKPISTLSGGQKTRVALGKLLLLAPDVLLLDEPTNHLDMESIAWLETYLLNYPGAVILVSHDRYFLDKVVSKVVELEHGSCLAFDGNYTAFAEKKKVIREAELHAWMNQQQEIAHHEAVITKLRSFNREKSIRRAESREKMLDKMEVLDKPENTDYAMKLELEPNVVSGNDVLHVENLSKAYPGLPLFSDVSFNISRGEKVAIIGKNGTGKTTILKILNRLIQPDGGKFSLGTKVKIGYYDQEHHVLHMDKTIFQEISDDYPSLNNTKIRNVLAAFLFRDDEVFQPISTLSGGERGRVSLAKLMLSEANFLILDEPTNHLDITSKEILESALKNYTGTVLYVSHDRYFINQTATRILDLTNQTLVNYIGNYDYYLEKRDELTSIYAPANVQEKAADAPSDTKLSWQQEKELLAARRKKENALKRLEDAIEKLEARDSEIDELFALEENATDAAKCAELSREKEEISEKLAELYEEWEALSE
ncbi:MAG: ABC-F family ATP-binding cassette domain-containing protein [Lachnospiraceae bacterium]|nr:ABC-F family ATP-binding cassette domain-containing protein [Lachnospiraceae bacterium]